MKNKYIYLYYLRKKAVCFYKTVDYLRIFVYYYCSVEYSQEVFFKMNMKKKVFVVVVSFIMASTFSSCDFKLSDLNFFNKDKTDDNAEIQTAVVEMPDKTYQWNISEINGGGYISGIVYNQSQEGLMYARTEKSGAFRYDAESGQWISISDFLTAEESSYMSVESIATDNNEPNRVYMACGTLEGGNGAIFSSEDYGNTWNKYELSFPCGGDTAGRGGGERLVIDPNDSSIIYYGSRSAGLWKTSNYGRTWSVVPSFETVGNFAQDTADIGVMWVSFDKASGSQGNPTLNIYAGVADVDGNTIYKSENAGITWEAVDTGMAGYYPVQAEFSDNGNLYIVFDNNATPDPDPGIGFIYSYNPQSDKFTDITPENSSSGSGYGGISVSNENPDMIVISTLGYHYPKDNIYISYDAGENWSSFSNGDSDFYDYSLSSVSWLGNDVSSGLGSWITSLCINPFDSNNLIFGNEKGVFSANGLESLANDEDSDESQNSNKTIEINDMNKGLKVISIRKVISAGGNIYSLSDSWGGFVQNDILQPVTSENRFSVSGSVDIDCAFNNPDIAVRCGEHSTYSSTPVLFTDDGGKTWYSTAAVPDGYEAYYNGTVAISSDGSSFIWVPDDKGAYPVITDDFGQTWNKCEGLPSGASVCSDKSDNMKFYAVSESSFYISNDGGRSFKRTDSQVPANSKPYSSFDEGCVWVCGGSEGAYYSSDYGQTFEKAEGVEADCVTFSRTSDDSTVIFMAGTVSDSGYGIYSSEDNGKTWCLVSDAQKQFGKKAVSISSDSKNLYIATDGRGILTVAITD